MRVCRWVWMVVRFVCVIRAHVCTVCPLCVPAPPDSLFTGLFLRLFPRIFRAILRLSSKSAVTTLTVEC